MPHFCILQAMEKLTLQISQALLRVCRYINQKDLRCRIEAHSVYLLELAAFYDVDELEKTLTIIEQLIFLGEGTGEIQYFNGQVLHSQFSILRSLIVEIRERKRIESAIDDIFSGDYEKHTKKADNTATINNAAINRQDAAIQAKVQDVKEPDYAFSGQNSNISGHVNNHGIQPRALPKTVIESDISGFTHGGTWSVERQELIARRISELGKAAMKDLIAAFPDVSERTLRYDLQKMNDRQIIERIGSGGPASYYVVKK